MKNLIIRKAIHLKEDEALLINTDNFTAYIVGTDAHIDTLRDLEMSLYNDEYTEVYSWRIVPIDSIYSFMDKDIYLKDEVIWEQYDRVLKDTEDSGGTPLFDELEFKPHESFTGTHVIATINGNRVSIVCAAIAYSNGIDTYEVMVNGNEPEG
jgi:hypothetical protein